MRNFFYINNKLSQRKTFAFISFFISIIYAFIPFVNETFEVKEFVFLGFLAISGYNINQSLRANENL